MNKILIAGATGNVGLATLRALQELMPPTQILAGVREIQRPGLFPEDVRATPVFFDLTLPETYGPLLTQTHTIFMLLPPGLKNGVQHLARLIQEAKNNRVKHVVYLSVQGADEAKFIPHHKIENQIIASGLSYTFLRPSYFMQNFTTVLLPDLRDHREIYLPAGKAWFNLIDVRDIGAVAAAILLQPELHPGQAYELTTPENTTFTQIAQTFTQELHTKITYTSPALWSFYFRKKQQGTATPYILIMMLLHFIPRFQKPPRITNWVQQITGKAPRTLPEFIQDHQALFKSNNSAID